VQVRIEEGRWSGLFRAPSRFENESITPIHRSGNVTVTVVKTAMGCPLNNVGSYFHCLTESSAALIRVGSRSILASADEAGCTSTTLPVSSILICNSTGTCGSGSFVVPFGKPGPYPLYELAVTDGTTTHMNGLRHWSWGSGEFRNGPIARAYENNDQR